MFTLEIDDVIHPVIAEYVTRGLEQAEEEGATAVIIQMSTPGGFDASMREIIEKILRSKIPVLIFVGPSGARAASAGFFILLSSDVAIMAPGTNTGAAHPVPLGGGKLDEVMQKKVENDAAAYIRSFVAKRGRNTELAEKGVLESVSFTEEEALEGNLIDGIAQNLNEILTKFDGQEIQRFDGQKQVLQLRDEHLKAIEMTVRQKVLSKVLNPNIALILGFDRPPWTLYRVQQSGSDLSRGGWRRLRLPGAGGIQHPAHQPPGSRVDSGGHRSFCAGGKDDQLRTAGLSGNCRHGSGFPDSHRFTPP